MNADDRRVDHLHGRVMGTSQCVHNLRPDARSSPADKAIVAGGVRPNSLGAFGAIYESTSARLSM